jgi:endonuclease/exonuclease/phosphatase family metal-dependent hydrolase
VLAESWSKGGDSQCARLAGPLSLPHHAFSGVTAQEDEAALSGVGVLSRWPIERQSSLAFGDARVQFAELAGPRGLIQVHGLVMDAWWLDQSQPRQHAVQELLTHVHQAQDSRAPLIICGDVNADPDSDEIRMLTGRTTAPAPGLSFYDAWEVAGPPGSGHTWSNDNPWATQLLWPSRRIDYIFSASPRPGGAGYPWHTALLGTVPVNDIYPSDHYAVLSDLHY